MLESDRLSERFENYPTAVVIELAARIIMYLMMIITIIQILIGLADYMLTSITDSMLDGINTVFYEQRAPMDAAIEDVESLQAVYVEVSIVEKRIERVIETDYLEPSVPINWYKNKRECADETAKISSIPNERFISCEAKELEKLYAEQR